MIRWAHWELTVFAMCSPTARHYPRTVARRLLEPHTAVEVDICFVPSVGWSSRMIPSIAAAAAYLRA
jgi:hypothetical protein